MAEGGRHKVWPIEGEIFSFYVESISDPSKPRRVEIDSYNFNGQCQCERFHFKCEPELSRGAKPKDSLRCSHIRDARSFFIDEVLPKIAKAVSVEAKPAPLVMRAEHLATLIAQSDDGTNLEDLRQLREHVGLLIEQVQSEIDSARVGGTLMKPEVAPGGIGFVDGPMDNYEEPEL